MEEFKDLIPEQRREFLKRLIEFELSINGNAKAEILEILEGDESKKILDDIDKLGGFD